ncbi:MAG: bifunctional serine/threonine-protein kinase/formylglycine-generating enzyme family protein [Blastocatellia bacterium]
MLEVWKCPTCSETYSPPTQFCLQDGARLEVARTLIGRVLDDRYRIEKLVGEGGMGTVYSGIHVQLDDRIAIKVLHPEMINNNNALKRFRQEARAARLIKHQNAVDVTDFGVTSDNLVYLVMEFVDGRNLRDLIDNQAMEYRRAIKLITQVCDAIDAAHQKGIVHRDLKPENIMVQGEGAREMVKVLDFGIAKMLEDDRAPDQQGRLTKAGTIMGTPQYMSPEQCQGKNIGPASDIYSIGIIAYEMLSGATPFTGNSVSDLLVKQLHSRPVPLNQIAPQVPGILAIEVMQSLEKAPALRHSSASELARCLRRAVRKADGIVTNDPYRDVVADSEEDEQTRNLFGKLPGKAASKDSMGGFEDVVIPRGGTKLIEEVLPRLESVKPAAPKTGKSPLVLGGVAVAVLLLAGLTYFLFLRNVPSKEDSPTLKTFSDKFGVMVVIPGGKFKMGRNDGDEYERPEHEVEVKDFLIDQREVTNKFYKEFVIATSHRAPSNWSGGSYPSGQDSFPVTNVTWTDAQAFAKWAGKRLPSEEEWEYVACNGSQELLYPWGNQWKSGNANAGMGATDPVSINDFDQDKSSLFAVYGLSGNVSEWVESAFKPYNSSLQNACPQCRVYRGGNFKAKPEQSTSTYRGVDEADLPSDPTNLKAYTEIVLPRVGFRCAKSYAPNNNQ